MYDAGTIRVYYNGQLSQTLGPTGGTALNSGITQCVIGTTVQSHTGMNGSICDFRVYDKALTEEEIYNLSKGLIAHYPLNCAPNSEYTSPAVEYDISGNNYTLDMFGITPNNLVTTGNIRYDKQDNFTAATQYLLRDSLSNAVTITFWGKMPASYPTGYQCYFADYINFASMGSGANLLVPRARSGGPLYNLPTSLKLNDWNFFVLVINTDKTTKAVYVNNELCTASSSNNFYTHSVNKFSVNARNNGSYTNGMNQAMSDLRVYATELTEEDRNRLYAMGRVQ